MVAGNGNGQNGHVNGNGHHDDAGGSGGRRNRRDNITPLLTAARWPTTPESRARLLSKLDAALKGKLTRREIASLARAYAQLEGQNQLDAHLLHKTEHGITDGQVVIRVEHAEVNRIAASD